MEQKRGPAGHVAVSVPRHSGSRYGVLGSLRFRFRPVMSGTRKVTRYGVLGDWPVKSGSRQLDAIRPSLTFRPAREISSRANSLDEADSLYIHKSYILNCAGCLGLRWGQSHVGHIARQAVTPFESRRGDARQIRHHPARTIKRGGDGSRSARRQPGGTWSWFSPSTRSCSEP